MNKWLFIWLVFVAGWYLIPWWNKVYFLWDDIELLLRFRHPTIETFLSSHQYQFFPVFKLFYWAETKLFGVNPTAFLAVSVILHLINIYITHRIIKSLTNSSFWGFIAAILVSFNKSYFTVIFWPTIQSNILLTTWSLLTLLVFFELKQKFSLNKLAKFLALILLNGLTFGFGIGTGFIFGIASLLFINNKTGQILAATAVITGLIITLAVLKFSFPEIQQSQVLSLSGNRLFNIAYFTAVGISQGVISRFFIPGFIPDIYNISNIAIMITLPTAILIFYAHSLFLMIKKRQFSDLLPLFLFACLLIVPYFIASLARSGLGALGGLAERYIYLPFFAFILAIIYSCHLFTKNTPDQTGRLKALLTYVLIIINLGHQAALYLALNQLFL